MGNLGFDIKKEKIMKQRLKENMLDESNKPKYLLEAISQTLNTYRNFYTHAIHGKLHHNWIQSSKKIK